MPQSACSGTELISVPDQIDQRIAFLEHRIAGRENEIADLCLRIQDVREALDDFLGEYNSRVGVHYVELEKIELEIKQFQFRLKRIREEKENLQAGVLDSIEEELQSQFQDQEQRIHNMEEETRRTADAFKTKLRKMEWAREFQPDELKKIKEIYRQLALRYHPDKAQTDAQRLEFQEIMSAINEAYAFGRIDILTQYLSRARKHDDVAEELKNDRLKKLEKEARVLGKMLKKLKAQLDDLVHGQAAKLRARVEEASLLGRDLLAELTESALQAIGIKRKELKKISNNYKNLAGKR